MKACGQPGQRHRRRIGKDRVAHPVGALAVLHHGLPESPAAVREFEAGDAPADGYPDLLRARLERLGDHNGPSARVEDRVDEGLCVETGDRLRLRRGGGRDENETCKNERFAEKGRQNGSPTFILPDGVTLTAGLPPDAGVFAPES